MKIIKKAILGLKTYASDTTIAYEKNSQKLSHQKCSLKFHEILNSLKQNQLKSYETKTWTEFNDRFELLCAKNGLPFDFLHDDLVLECLSCNPIKNIWSTFLTEIEQNGKFDLWAALHEDIIGNPRICDHKYLTSPGRIIHAYMLLQLNKIKADASNVVVEFGGGYGGFASIYRRAGNRLATYVIIDTPIMGAMQWHYLSSVLGPLDVPNVVNSFNEIAPNRINIVPVSMAEHIDITADLFFSTWALSEAGRDIQELMAKKRYFNAKHFLFTHQKASPAFPNAELFVRDLQAYNPCSVEMKGMFVNNYLVMK